MQTQRCFICLMIITGVMVLNACSTSRLNANLSTLPPDNLPASPGTEQSAQPTSTPSATRTPKIERETPIPIPTHSPTPTLDIASYTRSWVRFSDHIYGISIEYPLIYREKPYQGVCDPFETRAGVHFGETSEVFVRQRFGTSLDEHIQSFIQDYRPNEQLNIESQEAIQVNNRPAMAIKYKFGEAGQSREFVFVTVPESTLIYTFSFIGGSACDIPEIGLSERTVFEHALETFYVEK